MLHFQIEKTLNERVRPKLRMDGGDITVISFSEDTGELVVRLLGQCSGCPSAQLTTEYLVENEILSSVPEVKKVVLDTGVSAELLDFARSILRHEAV